ncbi:MAG: hypothetical protein ACYTF0_03365, partial [Planctomycetota bacterium]
TPTANAVINLHSHWAVRKITVKVTTLIAWLTGLVITAHNASDHRNAIIGIGAILTIFVMMILFPALRPKGLGGHFGGGGGPGCGGFGCGGSGCGGGCGGG